MLKTFVTMAPDLVALFDRNLQEECHDFANYDTFVIRVCGDGHRYKFTVRAEPRLDGAESAA